MAARQLSGPHLTRRLIPDPELARPAGFEPATVGLEGRGAAHEIVEQFSHPGLQRDFMFRIARKIIISMAGGTDPAEKDVETLVNEALATPFAPAAEAVIEADSKYVRARLIELAEMVAQGPQAVTITK